MQFVIPAPPVPALDVEGEKGRFPVYRIFCVGRNYADHAREMGHDPNREPPFFFMKPASAIVTGNADFPYPSATKDVHHEMELVVAIGKGGTNIPAAKALDHVYGYGVGIDMTRRDLQDVAKKLARPWEVAKAFEHSAPCTALVPAENVKDSSKGAIWLDVNGQRRQTGDLNQMIWDIPNQIAFLSGLFELKAGDLIFTGTPAGVGAVKKGDVMRAHVDGVGDLEVAVI